MDHPPYVRIIEVWPLPDWHILVEFETGERKIYDASWVKEKTGSLALSLHDERYFKLANVERGTVVWPNGFDLDPAWVYEESRPFKLEKEQAAAS